MTDDKTKQPKPEVLYKWTDTIVYRAPHADPTEFRMDTDRGVVQMTRRLGNHWDNKIVLHVFKRGAEYPHLWFSPAQVEKIEYKPTQSKGSGFEVMKTFLFMKESVDLTREEEEVFIVSMLTPQGDEFLSAMSQATGLIATKRK